MFRKVDQFSIEFVGGSWFFFEGELGCELDFWLWAWSRCNFKWPFLMAWRNLAAVNLSWTSAGFSV
ncbi:hypothetical protein V7266_19140, partial [Neobacillus drentensis]|uniref:hypothetical protein n=1 Tax=Neobacillus drentensis TaxID=220684 RepID=UPI002FFED176